MNNIKLIFRLIIGMIFAIVSVKYFLESDYLFGGVFLIVGIIFIVQIFINKKD